MDSFGWANRLARGRSYARRGQVLDFRLVPGRVTARVQGSRPQPYRVEITLRTLSRSQWDTIIGAMAARAAFAAKLLAGTMPAEIEDVFRRAKVPLFPESARDFGADCSCPDWADICKHIAAVHYILAEQFDRDPFMIFRLRGRDREELLAALRQARGAEASPRRRRTERLQEAMRPDAFWTLGPPFERVRVAPEPPTVELAVLRRLGEPPFAQARPERWERLRAVYRAVADRALEAAGREGPASRRTP